MFYFLTISKWMFFTCYKNMGEYWFSLTRIFPSKNKNTSHKFCPYTGKYGSKKIRILEYFTQCCWVKQQGQKFSKPFENRMIAVFLWVVICKYLKNFRIPKIYWQENLAIFCYEKSGEVLEKSWTSVKDWWFQWYSTLTIKCSIFWKPNR